MRGAGRRRDSAAGAIAPPSEEALKAFFNDRKSSYRAPEYRAIDVVALDPLTLAAGVTVTARYRTTYRDPLEEASQ